MQELSEQILKLVLGELEEPHATQLRERLRLDPDAARQAAHLEHTLASLRRAEELEPSFAIEPERLAKLQRAVAPPNAAAVNADAPSAGSRLATLIARLIADSWSGQPVPAIRGADGARSLTFLCQGHTIELRLEPSLERLGMFAVVGRATGPVTSAILWRELDTDTHHECAVDDLGFFEVNINAGRHCLDIATQHHTVCTPTFTHGTEQPAPGQPDNTP